MARQRANRETDNPAAPASGQGPPCCRRIALHRPPQPTRQTQAKQFSPDNKFPCQMSPGRPPAMDVPLVLPDCTCRSPDRRSPRLGSEQGRDGTQEAPTSPSKSGSSRVIGSCVKQIRGSVTTHPSTSGEIFTENPPARKRPLW